MTKFFYALTLVLALAAPAHGTELPATPAPVRESASTEPRLFKGVVIQTFPEFAEITAGGRYRSSDGVLEVPISSEAHSWPQSFTITVKSRDYMPMRKVISNHPDWVRFFMVAGPAMVVAAGYTVPLFDPAKPQGDKIAAGLTVVGSLITIGQTYFQSYKFDDVYTIDLDREARD